MKSASYQGFSVALEYSTEFTLKTDHFTGGAQGHFLVSGNVLFRSVNYDMVNTNRHCANNSYICLSASKHDICSIIVKINKILIFGHIFRSRDVFWTFWAH